MHYQRWLKYGGTGPAGKIGKWASLEDRFTDNVQTAGPLPDDPELGRCHNWTGSITKDGYGKICDAGRTFYAHRLAWRIAYGVWPHRLKQVCGHRRCVRVEHLQEVRGVSKSGHPAA